MPTEKQIKLLASRSNERGDLFTRLVKDLFYTLGYDNLRCDVARTGREIDILGVHRYEPRGIVAECKAHVKKMGGKKGSKVHPSKSQRSQNQRVKNIKKSKIFPDNSSLLNTTGCMEPL